MPVFHFNLADHVCEPDIEGTMLDNADQARVEAIVLAGAIVKDNPSLIQHGKPFCVEVTDDAGVAMFAVKIEIIEA